MVYIHPAKERNGRRIFVEGNFKPEETFLLIDDLVTSGGGILEAAAFLKQNARADVRDVLVLLDRDEGARELLKAQGYNLINILGLETMLNYLMAKGLIEEDQFKRSIDYIQSRREERARLTPRDKPSSPVYGARPSRHLRQTIRLLLPHAPVPRTTAHATRQRNEMGTGAYSSRRMGLRPGRGS